MEKNILSVRGLTKSFSDIVLSNVTFDVLEKTKVALVGLNGVGKSTCVNIISGVCDLDEGEVVINEKFATCFTNSFLPEYISIFELCKYRNLDLTKLDYFLNMFDIKKYKNTFIKFLSTGTIKKVEIIFTLLKDVSFIILDEPTIGLDFSSVVKLSEYIKKDHRTYLVVSHDFQFLNQFIDEVLLLEDKQVKKRLKYNKKSEIDIVEIFSKLENNYEDTI